MACTILLGAEGCSELESAPYIRDATPEEIAAWDVRYPRLEKVVNNRPYFLVVVDVDHSECPREIADRARKVVRTVRLTE
jgi:hypothetical protein